MPTSWWTWGGGLRGLWSEGGNDERNASFFAVFHEISPIFAES